MFQLEKNLYFFLTNCGFSKTSEVFFFKNFSKMSPWTFRDDRIFVIDNHMMLIFSSFSFDISTFCSSHLMKKGSILNETRPVQLFDFFLIEDDNVINIQYLFFSVYWIKEFDNQSVEMIHHRSLSKQQPIEKLTVRVRSAFFTRYVWCMNTK